MCFEILFDQLHLCGKKTLFLLYRSMEKMFDIQKIAKVLASKRLKNIPTEYFASYIGFLLLNFNFDINKKIGFKKCFLGFYIGGNMKIHMKN